MSSDFDGGAKSGAAGGPVADDPVLLTSVNDPTEAEIILAKLRSAGIEAWLRHEAAGVVFGLTVDGLGQQDLMVRPEDLAEAQAALELEPTDDTGQESEE